MADMNTRSETLPQLSWQNGVPGYWFGTFFLPRMAGGETPPNPGEGDPPKGDDPKDDDDPDDWDKARAAATIRKQREDVRALREKVKEADALKARLQALEDKDKSELERATSKAAEVSEKLTAAEQRAQDLLIRLSVERAAGKLGFHDTDDAYRLIDRRAVELDDDGEPTNVEKLLADLAKAKPHLVKSEDGEKGTARTATRSVPATPKPSGQQPTRDERIEETRKELARSGRYAPL